MPEYTEWPEWPEFLTFESRQRAYEISCYGCQRPLDKYKPLGIRYNYRTEPPTPVPPHQAVPCGILVNVITDRSGSEQATTHRNDACIAEAFTMLLEEA